MQPVQSDALVHTQPFVAHGEQVYGVVYLFK